MKFSTVLAIFCSATDSAPSFAWNATKRCTDRGGCDCDCSWASDPSKCGTDDGSCCWGCCCSAPAPVSPTPAPASPTPPPFPPTPTPTNSTTVYCPTGSDMNLEHGTVTFQDGGWAFTGDARVSSKTSWNLLGGYMQFDMDTSKVAPEVNTNFYTSSPDKPNCGETCYCDIQKSESGKPSCMEMDIIEVNGHCAMATTIHTFATDGKPNNADCDRWGCGSTNTLPGPTFTIKASFGMDGSLSVTMDGSRIKDYNIAPSAASNDVVVKTMSTIGAVIESSQWFGWAPAEDQCPSGSKDSLPSSEVRISNVRVVGKVVQGPEPTKCQ